MKLFSIGLFFPGESGVFKKIPMKTTATQTAHDRSVKF